MNQNISKNNRGGETANFLNSDIKYCNKSGASIHTSSTLANWQKTHGLFICKNKEFNDEHCVLLSSINESLYLFDCEYQLGINTSAKENRAIGFIKSIQTQPVYEIEYSIGPISLKKQIVLATNENRLFIRYSLGESQNSVAVMLRPFVTFRNIFALNSINTAKYSTQTVENGIKIKNNNIHPALILQLSKTDNYIQSPEWQQDIQYSNPINHEIHYHEDIYSPGFFSFQIKENESIILSIASEEIDKQKIKKMYINELNNVIYNMNEALIQKNKKNIIQMME